jgi:hypothetical protein
MMFMPVCVAPSVVFWVVSCGLEEFKNPKGVFPILKSKNDRQHNVHMENDKQLFTDIATI